MTHDLSTGPKNFGVFLAPFHKMGISPTVHFQRDLQLIEHIDKLGFQEAWIGEHHTGGHEPIGCPEMVLTAAAERTQQIKLGTGVNSLSYHNPLLLAERLVLLDHLSRGRAMMGFGPGQLASDAHMFGIPVTEQRRMMLESAEVILQLLRGEVVTRQTDWFTLQDAHLQVLPYSVPTFECVVAAVASPSGPTASGRLGIGMMNLAATGKDAFAALRGHWEIAEREAAAAGNAISRENWRLAGIMHIAETEEQARKDCEYGFAEIWDYLGQISPLPLSNETTVEGKLNEAIEAGMVTIGTPDTAIQLIRDLTEQTGGFGTFLMNLADFASPAARLKACDLFAEHVIPEFRGQMSALRRSHSWVLDAKDGLGGTKWKTQTTDAIASAAVSYEEQNAVAG